MSFVPLNRHLLVKPVGQDEDSEPAPAILLPDGYKPVKSGYEAVEITQVAKDCNLALVPGQVAIVQASMIDKIDYEGREYWIVLQNHVVGTIEREA